MTEVFREQYGREPKVEAIHAGLECGLFCGKLPGLDCGACGAPTCRAFAEDVVKGTCRKTDCVFVYRKQMQKVAKTLGQLEGWTRAENDEKEGGE